MVDLHTHTIFSDGQLIPAELAQRAGYIGYTGLAFTDHADQSNLEHILCNLTPAVKKLNQGHPNLKILAGIELTHIPPAQIKGLVAQARDLGAQIVVVHGQTIVEPVPQGTNLAAIEAGVNILAHPGLITLEEAKLAQEKGVYLELSARSGHCLANGHVARMAQLSGASLVINSDSHSPFDLITLTKAVNIGLGAGLDEKAVQDTLANSKNLLNQLFETSML